MHHHGDTRAREKPDALTVLWWVEAGAAALAALAHFGTYLYVAISRMSFPFALEWVEGSSFVQVSRILAGEPLYGRPSFNFVADIYSPLYFYVAAAASHLLGGGFLPLRLVSFLSSLAILTLIAVLVREQTGSAFAGFLAAGFFSATFALTGYWFDLGRVDTLALAFLLLSVYLLVRDQPLSCALGGVALALSCLTKQTFLAMAVVLAVCCVVPPRRNSLIFLGTGVGLFGVVTLTLNWIYEGWYVYYLFELPTHSPLKGNSALLVETVLGIVERNLVRHIPLALFLGLVYWFAFPASASETKASTETDRAGNTSTWPRRSLWWLLSAVAITAVISIWYLGASAADAAGQHLGPSPAVRLGLIVCQAILGAGAVSLGMRLAKDRDLLDRIVSILYGDVRLVPRILLACTILAWSAASILLFIRPTLLHSPRVERLLPFAVEAILAMAIILLSWRLIWGVVRLKTWLLIFLAAGLMTTSVVAHLMKGSYSNALIPGYAGASILLGLGIGHLLLQTVEHPSRIRQIAGIVALGALTAQFAALYSPWSSQIPSNADAQAGLELVKRMKDCPVDIYVPFDSYLSEMAGKPVYAGHQDMVSLWLFDDPDPLWGEVRSEMESALTSGEIPIVLATGPYQRFLSRYEVVGSVFEDAEVFWPVTGMRVRPEIVYAYAGASRCDLHIP